MQTGESSPALSDSYVLDSFALLAYLEAEDGASRVRELMEAVADGSCHLYMTVVNLGEVLYITERERGLPKAQELLARVNEMPIEIVTADLALTMAASHLKANSTIAYADCFAAALAKLKESTLLTGDPEFSKIDQDAGIDVEWLSIP